MSLATTQTDIANLALKSLGAEPIQSIDAADSNSRLVRTFIDEVARQVQIDINWPELLTVDYPTQYKENFGDSESLYRYQLPENFLSLVEISTPLYWEINGNALITAAKDPQVIFKVYSDNVAAWSAELVELTYKKLAAEISMPITQNTQLVQMAAGKYEARSRELKPIMKNRSRKKATTLRRFSYLQCRSYQNFGAGKYE